MIRKLTGQPEIIDQETLVIDVNGVGYEVFVPPKQLPILAKESTVTLHVYTHVREDQFSLFGFSELSDRQLFTLLLDVSGVGPKSALMIVNESAAAVIQAIQQSDVSFFSHIPRIGKKTAQKIILELQSKVGALEEFQLEMHSNLHQDLKAALLNMGYTERDVDRVVRQVEPDLDIATALRWCLKNIGKQE